MANIQCFDDVNKTLLEIAKKDSFITKKEVDMNERINKIKNQFDEETKEIRAQKLLLEQEVQAYSSINKDVFGKLKSKSLLFGTIFFRTTPPKVSQLNKKYSIATSIELAKKIFKTRFIRSKEELDKDSILTAYAAKEISDEKLAAIGLKIDQEEKFGYELNWEKLGEV
jgi:phage host-nuclease inhibitor protein Gam